MELDRIDVAILRALQEDARLSFRALAARVGVSPPTVSERVGRLEELGILRGYRADVAPEPLGERTVVLVVKAKPRSRTATARALADLPELRLVLPAQGPHVVALATLPPSADVEDLLERVARVDGVRDYEHYVVASAVKDVPRAVLAEGLAVTLTCFQCGKVIEGDPIVARLDGRDHYLCCPSCEQLYTERYRRIKAGT